MSWKCSRWISESRDNGFSDYQRIAATEEYGASRTIFIISATTISRSLKSEI